MKVLKTNLTLKTCPLGASFSSLGCFVFEIWVLRASVFVFETFWLLRFRSRVIRFRVFRCFVFEIWVVRASVFVFECFVFETFWVLRFRSRVLRFRVFRCFVFVIWVLRASVFVFETFWVLRFRDLGASCLGPRFHVLRFRNFLGASFLI